MFLVCSAKKYFFSLKFRDEIDVRELTICISLRWLVNKFSYN